MLLPARIQSVNRHRLLRWVGFCLLIGSLIGSFIWLRGYLSRPREAPEIDRILQAQASLPFQVLIPAYLPGQFNRGKVEIHTDRSGPQGESLVQLVYSTRQGDKLALNEWVPANGSMNGVTHSSSGGMQLGMHACRCMCQANKQCIANQFMMDIGPLRVTVEMSAANLLSIDQVRTVLDTLSAAANLHVYTQLKQVPPRKMPPAVQVPLNAEGVQEVVLVVAPDGYAPAHFSVRAGVPVRLIFRQLGQVGCGNELVFTWGSGQSTKLTLSGPSDTQTLEFTPVEAGDFPFNCPHEIYRGVMSVQEP